jgi:hypothetical protein
MNNEERYQQCDGCEIATNVLNLCNQVKVLEQALSVAKEDLKLIVDKGYISARISKQTLIKISAILDPHANGKEGKV